jgi:hypothetical protein
MRWVSRRDEPKTLGRIRQGVDRKSNGVACIYCIPEIVTDQGVELVTNHHLVVVRTLLFGFPASVEDLKLRYYYYYTSGTSPLRILMYTTELKLIRPTHLH